MSTRFTQRQRNRIRSSQRSTNSNSLTFGRFATALGGGLVLILLAATFLGDYLRVPALTASASPSLISPNGDQTQDSTSIAYTIADNADVALEVYTPNGSLVKTLSQVDAQPAGQYVVLWDGTDNNNSLVEDGRYLIEITAKGTSRAAQHTIEIRVDTEAPFLRLTNLEEVNRVADPNLAIDGLTNPGVVVYQAGSTDPIPVNNEGQFQIIRQLVEGSNIIEVLASDQAGNTARTSHEVLLITTPPDLAINSPTVDQWLSEPIVQVSGVAPSAASITVNNQAATLRDDGSFNREVILQEGDNTLRIAVTDDVGNITTQERIVHLKTTPPEISLNMEDGTVLNQSTVQLTGRTEPGSTVLINDQVVPVSTLGEFQTAINLVNGSNTIQVAARDIAGNTSTLQRRVVFRSPTPQNELTRLFSNLPPLSSLGTPMLIIIPSLLLLGYLFTRPVSLLLSAESDSFTPGLPEENRAIAFTLDLSRSARTTIEVLNKHQQVVATITHRRQRGPGTHTFYWDGYDDFDNVAPAGEYLVQALASTPGASVRSATSITIYEDPLAHGQYSRQYESQPVEQDRVAVRRGGRRNRR
jgi:flagellar hook assembly protein FlgD